MRNAITILSFVLVFFLISCNLKKPNQISEADLRAGFVTPPKSIQTSVYWYWISDHISEEGVIKDLQAMKKAGINRAFIGNIGLADANLAGGKVKFGSEEWWKVIHTTLKTATELDIEIGIFNSPGWSQSGGPWIKPNQAMRYLTSTKTRIKGGGKIDITLDKPEGDFEDVKVIAYPALNMEGAILSSTNAKITSDPLFTDITNLIDGKRETEAVLKGEGHKEVKIDITSVKDFTLRSVKIFTQAYNMNTPAKFQVKEGNEYKTLAEFMIDRYNGAANVGFDPNAPIVISVPATTAKEFRLVVSSMPTNVGLKEIELSSIPSVERYPEKTLGKMFQSPLPYWNEYQWKVQPQVEDKSLIVDASKVIDISQNLSGDKLVWDAPEGDWIIMRTGMKPTGTTNAPASPEATGLEVDKMSKKHVEAHFEAYMAEITRRIPAADRKSWKVVVQDSYETGGQNFTDDFLAEFKVRYGYDPLPFLPVYDGVVVQSEDVSDRFLWDMRRLVADKVSYDYVGGLREISHKYGLTTWLENYGHWGFPGEFLQYGGQSDEIGGEFWGEGDLGNIENRAASSCGHIYGKTKISAESFTTAGNPFGRYPSMIKQRGDRFFSEGINNTLLHLYTHQPYEDKDPGINAWFGTEFNRKNTWFSQMDLFTDYLKRVNFMLQQGLNIADVAYFIGEDAPKMTGIADPALPKGYQFDYINAEVIEKNLTVKNGLLTLPHGTQYKILVLPKLETMRPELLKKIKQLIEDGGVIMGPAPQRSPSYQNYPQADKEIQDMATSLWSGLDGTNVKSKKIGKGTLINGMDMQQALDLIGYAPDCKTPDDTPILYGHRTMGEVEIYFITNQSNQQITVSPEFRIKGMQPELWEPTTGSTRKLAAYTPTNTGTIVPLKLESNESAFIVFMDKASATPKTTVEDNFPVPQTLADMNGPWTVTFDKNRRGPQEPVIMQELKDISQNENSDIKYYSGNIWYNATFNMDKLPKSNVIIDLNEVSVMARVKINDKYVGGVWTPPYRLDITEYVKEGENKVEIEVVNTWVNRIIGDMKLPENERKVSLTTNSWNADSPLQRSGLIGPVKIQSVSY